MTKPRPRDFFAVPSFTPCLVSGLKSIARFLHPRLPAAAERLIQADDSKKAGTLRLRQRVFRLEQGQLRIEHGDDGGRARARPLLGEIECAAGGVEDVTLQLQPDRGLLDREQRVV